MFEDCSIFLASCLFDFFLLNRMDNFVAFFNKFHFRIGKKRFKCCSLINYKFYFYRRIPTVFVTIRDKCANGVRKILLWRVFYALMEKVSHSFSKNTCVHSSAKSFTPQTQNKNKYESPCKGKRCFLEKFFLNKQNTCYKVAAEKKIDKA